VHLQRVNGGWYSIGPKEGSTKKAMNLFGLVEQIDRKFYELS